MKPVLVTPPAEQPVTLVEVKGEARVDFSDDDTLLESYLASAIAHLDGYSGILGRCMVTQVWRQDFRCWGQRLRLPFPDVESVVVKYFDDGGVEQTLDAADYELVEGHLGAEVIFKEAFIALPLDSDRRAPISVELTAGYGAPAEVPADIKVAIQALTRHWYDGEPGLPPQMALLQKYRFVRV